jgi:valyl-tRNA synthetase
MSKSKGNVQDPLELLATYGTDALRFTLVAHRRWAATSGCRSTASRAYRSFANKIWNAARFVLMNLDGYDPARPSPPPAGASIWISRAPGAGDPRGARGPREYHFNDAANATYRFLWNELCDWYVELAKIELASEDATRRTIAQHTPRRGARRGAAPPPPAHAVRDRGALERPAAARRKAGYLIDERYPVERAISAADEAEEARYERLIEIVRALRSVRSELNIPAGREIEVRAVCDAAAWSEIEREAGAIRRLARVATLTLTPGDQRPRGAAVVVAGGVELYVPLGGLIDVSAERDRLRKEIARLDAEVLGVRRKLENDDFVARAPEEVVTAAREKADDLSARRGLLERGLGLLAEVDA